MLEAMGLSSLDQLFRDIPEEVRLSAPLNLPPPQAEADVMGQLERLAAKNTTKVLFAGTGQYDHVIPAAVARLIGRAEFVTAYTPYQPEISQGILQALFEFQSAMAEITGLPVSNASLYDGATAAAEAGAMALGACRTSKRLLIASTVHPYVRTALETHFRDLDVQLEYLPEEHGHISLKTLKEALQSQEGTAGVLVQTPNIYGIIEDLTGWAEAIHEAKGHLIISSNPVSLGALRSPAEWGADIAVGDNQPLGLPPCFGGPSAGYICCTEKLMRRMPGRIVGESVDADGRRAFVLTLQAREQHIKRERATSNICTNQSLAALANLVYLSLLGPQGYEELAQRNIQGTLALQQGLRKLGLHQAFEAPNFNEFVVKIPVPREDWEKIFATKGILSGTWLSTLSSEYSKDLLAICVTEKRTAQELQQYLACAQEALQ